MLGSPILDVAIGMVFFYVTLSLLCTTISEWWSRMKDKRGAILEDAVLALLRAEAKPGDKLAGAQDLVKKVMESPLVRPGIADDRPTHIDPKGFADALIGAAGGDQVLTSIDEVRDAVVKVEPPELRNALVALVSGGRTTFEDARDRVAEWFDEAMANTTHAYRTAMQKVVSVIGVVLVLFLNADSLVLFETLWVDDTMRASIVAAAEKAVEKADAGSVAGGAAADTASAGAAGDDTSGGDDASGASGDGSDTSDDDSGASDGGDASGAGPDLATIIANAHAQLAPFPIGWPELDKFTTDPRGFVLPGNERHFGDWATAILRKIAGLLVTIIAVSLGAPFWFDLLKKLISMRKPEKAPAQPAAKTN